MSNDVLIHGKTPEKFMLNLREIFERFRTYNITSEVNPKKCTLGLTEVIFVNHTINKEGTIFSQERIQRILELPLPNTITMYVCILLMFQVNSELCPFAVASLGPLSK